MKRAATLGRIKAILKQFEHASALILDPSSDWKSVKGACEVADALCDSLFFYIDTVRPSAFFISCVEQAMITGRGSHEDPAASEVARRVRTSFRSEYPELEVKLTEQHLVTAIQHLQDNGGSWRALMHDINGRNGSWAMIRRAIGDFDDNAPSEQVLRRHRDVVLAH